LHAEDVGARRGIDIVGARRGIDIRGGLVIICVVST
jgi:hypothetical protein